jgi:hypothetical protein
MIERHAAVDLCATYKRWVAGSAVLVAAGAVLQIVMGG